MDKMFVAVQITALIVVSSILGGMIVFSDVYYEVQSNIVSVTCLSCIKLQPKTVIEFKFDTYQDKPHPDFVLDNLTEGPVFLAYRTIVCEFCDVMDEVLEDIFEVRYTVEDPIVVKKINFDGTTLTFIHINKDLVSDSLKNSQEVYMQDVFKTSVPMFTLVTIRYTHGGDVEEYYATAYGVLEKDTFEERKAVLLDIIQNGVDLYKENEPGYQKK
jgi:hypothetical protein